LIEQEYINLQFLSSFGHEKEGYFIRKDQVLILLKFHSLKTML